MVDINFVTRVQNINADFANRKKKYALVFDWNINSFVYFTGDVSMNAENVVFLQKVAITMSLSRCYFTNGTVIIWK